MGFLPINIFMVVVYLLGIIWGWEGEEMRQFFANVSSFFMFSLWLIPLFSITNDAGCCTIVKTSGWLPTGILEFVLFWNVVLMYFTGAHLMQTLGREEPIGKGLKRLRKQR
jgi:hypothetical protein